MRVGLGVPDGFRPDWSICRPAKLTVTADVPRSAPASRRTSVLAPTVVVPVYEWIPVRVRLFAPYLKKFVLPLIVPENVVAPPWLVIRLAVPAPLLVIVPPANAW